MLRALTARFVSHTRARAFAGKAGSNLCCQDEKVKKAVSASLNSSKYQVDQNTRFCNRVGENGGHCKKPIAWKKPVETLSTKEVEERNASAYFDVHKD